MLIVACRSRLGAMKVIGVALNNSMALRIDNFVHFLHLVGTVMIFVWIVSYIVALAVVSIVAKATTTAAEEAADEEEPAKPSHAS